MILNDLFLAHYCTFLCTTASLYPSVCKGRPGITPQTKYSGSGTGCLRSGMVSGGEGGEHLARPLHFQWAKEFTTDPVDLLADVSAGTTRVCFREWALGWKCLPPYVQENVPKCLAALLLGALHSVSVKNQRGSCWETASWHLEIIPCSELLSSGSTGAYLFAYSCRVLFLPCHITVSAISNCKE